MSFDVLLCSCWPAWWPPLCSLLGQMACCEPPHSCHHKHDSLNLTGQKHQTERDIEKHIRISVANYSHLWADLHFVADMEGNVVCGEAGVGDEWRCRSPHNCWLSSSWLGPACWEGSHKQSGTKAASSGTEHVIIFSQLNCFQSCVKKKIFKRVCL